jgi:hypothetical protein
MRVSVELIEEKLETKIPRLEPPRTTGRKLKERRT